MTKALQIAPKTESVTWTEKQKELIKSTVANGTDDDEFKLFLYVAKQRGLDPLLRQIHAVMRWDSMKKREAMAIQVGIDGYRLIAARTGRYCPGSRTEFETKQSPPGTMGQLLSATAFVKVLIPDGQGGHQWTEVSETAYFDEYCARKKDGKPNHMWANKPRIMLAKCAEALVLRKAFPAELSGLYTNEEMQQADNSVPTSVPSEVVDVRVKHIGDPPDDLPMPESKDKALEDLRLQWMGELMEVGQKDGRHPGEVWWALVKMHLPWVCRREGDEDAEVVYKRWSIQNVTDFAEFLAEFFAEPMGEVEYDSREPGEDG